MILRPTALSSLLLMAVVCCTGMEADSEPSPRLAISVSPTPATVGPARILIQLDDQTGMPVAGATIRVFALREGSGDRTAQDIASESSPGRYVATDFSFPSAGNWTLHVQANLPDGGMTETRHLILVVGPPPF